MIAPGNNAPTQDAASAHGAHLAAEWHRGTGSLLRLCLGVKNGYVAYEKNKALLDAFLAPLVEADVFTAEEAILGRSASKISMFCQIAEHEQLLKAQGIARHLMSGYTIVYQACVIFKQLKGDEAQRTAELERILAACPEDGARDYLLGVTRRLKRDAAAERHPRRTEVQSAGNAPPVTTLRALMGEGRRFDLIVLTPGDDLRLLGDDYPEEVGQEESTLASLLPIHRVAAGDAVAIVAAPHRDFPIVTTRLLELCGFSRPSRVLLTRQNASRDITDADILVVAKRGAARLDLPGNSWGGEGGVLEPLDVAARLCPDAARRLHLFASAQAQGWCCVRPEESWLERPSVR